MPTRKRGAASPDADQADALALSAEEAEAQAVEAEAAAEAARARAKAIRLRREAEAAEAAQRRDAEQDSADTAEEIEFPETGAEIAAPRRRLSGALRYVAVAVAIAAIAALSAASGWMVYQHRKADQQRQLTAEFVAAARQGVVSLMSLNFSSAKEDVQRILDNSTGQFKQDFQDQADEFTKVAESSKVVTESSVAVAAVKTMTQDTADVLVAANSTITNMQGAKQNPRNWRLIVSMARDGGQIKMAKVEFAP